MAAALALSLALGASLAAAPAAAASLAMAPAGAAPAGQGQTACAGLWQQCGGAQWAGASCCEAGTCQKKSEWFHQCAPAEPVPPAPAPASTTRPPQAPAPTTPAPTTPAPTTPSAGQPGNKYQHSSGVGRWGGLCTCPDGQQYEVGDRLDSCASLACEGGTAGPCSAQGISRAGAGMKVVCGRGGAPAPPPTTTRAPTAAPATGAVALHGRLHVSGNRVVNQNGEPVRLRGMSLFWSQWMPQYYNRDAVRWLADDWQVTLVRAAMGVESGGYLENPAREQQRMEDVVQAAIESDIYVIIDWHDHNADTHVDQAKGFFMDMAQKYGKYPNVIFETFNEPVGQGWAENIKPYHAQVVPVIRQYSDNLIVLGTRMWSQKVDEASRDPVPGTNLAYTIHFYAATHGADLRAQVSEALNNGVAVFATEWGTCEASGDGRLDLAQTQAWMDFFVQHHISDANWAVGDKAESCAALRPGAAATGGWKAEQLTPSGAYVRASLRGEGTSAARPPSKLCANGTEDCRSYKCCADPAQRCYLKDDSWGSCRESCMPGVNALDPPAHRTPWSCRLLDIAGLIQRTDTAAEPRARIPIAPAPHAGRQPGKRPGGSSRGSFLSRHLRALVQTARRLGSAAAGAALEEEEGDEGGADKAMWAAPNEL